MPESVPVEQIRGGVSMSWQFSDQRPLTSSLRHHLGQAPRVVIFLLQAVGHIGFPCGPRGYRHCRTCFAPRRSSRRYVEGELAMNRMRRCDRSDPIDAWRRRIQRPESNPLKLPLQQNGIGGFQRRWTCRLPPQAPAHRRRWPVCNPRMDASVPEEKCRRIIDAMLARYRRASNPRLRGDRRQGLVEIAHDVLGRLQADGEPHHIGPCAGGQALLVAQLAMGGGSGM